MKCNKSKKTDSTKQAEDVKKEKGEQEEVRNFVTNEQIAREQRRKRERETHTQI